MGKITFFVPGKPMGKGRPRFGNGQTYTPKKTLEYEKLVQQCYLLAGGRKMKGYISFSFRAFYPIPTRKDNKYVTKKQREQMLTGIILPDTKPDGDNIEKIILDALTGVAYEDDKQVVRCDGWNKMYSKDPGVLFTIGEVRECR